VAFCKNKSLKKPDIFYHVKITNVNFHHTCQMTTIFHPQALQKSGGLQHNLNGLNDIMLLLWEKPMFSDRFLQNIFPSTRPQMRSSLPTFENEHNIG
jgi:hypothetical protein